MSIEGAGIGLLLKTKLLTVLPALVGACIMAVFRPPTSRKEVFTLGASAFVASYLFGDVCTSLVTNWLGVPREEVAMAVYGLVGSLSWGIFSGLATLRDKLSTDPIQTAKDVKDVVS